MGLIVKTFCRVECDCCGATTEHRYENVADAKSAALQEHFVISEWLLDGCPRQTAFCPLCVKRLMAQQAQAMK